MSTENKLSLRQQRVDVHSLISNFDKYFQNTYWLKEIEKGGTNIYCIFDYDTMIALIDYTLEFQYKHPLHCVMNLNMLEVFNKYKGKGYGKKIIKEIYTNKNFTGYRVRKIQGEVINRGGYEFAKKEGVVFGMSTQSANLRFQTGKSIEYQLHVQAYKKYKGIN